MHNLRQFSAIFTLVWGLICSFDVRSEQDLRAIHTELLESINLLKDKKYAEACVKLKLLPTLDESSNDPISKTTSTKYLLYSGTVFCGIGFI
ncbi:hypothetical protein [Psychrosphaera algicola]|uniref:Uncharacterized protein n=1 Tax=Psychrosphaera algicola TaxID=3023714 RepID=A0ABT5FFA4_9GAMM|nr:hypothetical protein [Psychrosphaera sp. G1-22]MDC2890198.1 hypothetical protein [Psychrosphaera sp. G1-22]